MLRDERRVPKHMVEDWAKRLMLKRIVILGVLVAGSGYLLWRMDRSRYPYPVVPPEPQTKQETPRPPKPGAAPTPGSAVVIETNRGRITVVLYEKDAPKTTENFVGLVQRRFYDGLKFHRVDPGFVVQTGDPTGTGSGGSGQTIPLETTPVLRHDQAGTVGMARGDDPNSATSQFYITLRPTPELDRRYAVFGRVLDGMDVVLKIRIGDRVKRVYLLPKAEGRAS